LEWLLLVVEIAHKRDRITPLYIVTERRWNRRFQVVPQLLLRCILLLLLLLIMKWY